LLRFQVFLADKNWEEHMAGDRTTIDNAYRTVLARAATDEEAQFYANASQAKLQSILYDSNEYRLEVLPVAAMYFSILGRQPDPSGLSFWVNALRDGKLTRAQAAEMFLTSPEASAAFGYADASNQVFVARNYFNTLGRDPDEGGLKFWVGLLDSHTITRAEVALSIAISPEHMVTVDTVRYVSFDTGGVEGVVADGYLAGATVFADANGDGVWNAGEARTVTDNHGHFSLENAKGNLVAMGGKDISTGLDHTGAYTAAAGSSVVNPLTTLQLKLMTQGKSSDQAQDALAAAFRLDLDAVDLRTYDPVSIALGSYSNPERPATAVKLQAVAAKVANLLTAASSTLVGAAGQANLTAEQAFAAVAASLGSAIGKAGSRGIDLSDEATLQAVLKDSVLAAGNAALSEKADDIAAMSAAFAQLLAASARQVDTVMASGWDPMHALALIAQIQTAVQGELAGSLKAGAANGTLANLIDSFTGASLGAFVSTTTIGDIDPLSNLDDEVIHWVNRSGTTPSSSGGDGSGGTGGGGIWTTTPGEISLAQLRTLGLYWINGMAMVLVDTQENVESLTPGEIAAFRAGALYRAFQSTSGRFTLNVDQAQAMLGLGVHYTQVVTIRDTSARLSLIDIATWPTGRNGDGTTIFDATDNTLSIGSVVAARITAANLTVGDTVTLTDTAAAISALTASSLGNANIDRIHVSDGATLKLTVAQFQAVLPKLDSATKVYLFDDAASLGSNLVYDSHVSSITAKSDQTITWPHATTPEMEAAALGKLTPGSVIRLIQAGAMIEGETVHTAALVNPQLILVRQEGTGPGAQLLLLSSTLQTMTALGTDIVAAGGVHVAADIRQELLNDRALRGGSLTLEYTTAEQAGTATLATHGPALTEGDRFGLYKVDVVTSSKRADSDSGLPTQDRLLLSNFNLSAGSASDFGDDGTINNGHFITARGTLAGSVFTVAANGNDTLVVWDADPGSAVLQAAAVLAGTPLVEADTSLARAGNVLFAPPSNHYLTVSQALAQNDSLSTDATVIVSDSDTNIGALTLAQLANLTKVDRFQSAGGVLHLSVAQALAMTAQRTTPTDTVIISDKAAAIQALTPEQLNSLIQMDKYHATDGPLTLNARQIAAMWSSQITTEDSVILSDTSANLYELFNDRTTMWQAATALDVVHASDANIVRMTVEQANRLVPKLDDSVHIAMVDTAESLWQRTTYLSDPHVTLIVTTDYGIIRVTDPAVLGKLAQGERAYLSVYELIEGQTVSTEQLLDLHVRKILGSIHYIAISAATFNAVTDAGRATFGCSGGVLIQASAGQEIISDKAVEWSALLLSYDVAGRAGTATAHLAAPTAANGDTFTLVNVDRLIHDPARSSVSDQIRLAADFALNANSWSSTLKGSVVADASYASLRGTLNGEVFTVDSSGADTLLLWDEDPLAGHVKQAAAVVVGAGELQHWQDNDTHAILIGIPYH
jgi:hypothetical protein